MFGLPRWLVENTALVIGIIVLFGGVIAVGLYADHSDKQLKKRVLAAMHELPMGSTPAQMRGQLGDPDDVDIRTIKGRRAFCLGYTVAVYGDADLRWACYVHGQRVR